MNQLGLLQRINLYKLKRDYGAPIEICKLLDSQVDIKTGKRSISTSVFPVERAIALPATQSRKALMRKMAAGTEASRDFTASGAYDLDVRDFIIDRRDTPTIPELTDDDWIIYHQRKYQIAKVQTFGNDDGWIITANEIRGNVPTSNTSTVQTGDGLPLSESL